MILCLVACFLFLSIVRIFVANRLVDISKKTYELDLVETRIRAENEDLDIALSQKSSLGAIMEKAGEFGFTESPKVVFAKSVPTVAAKLP